MQLPDRLTAAANAIKDIPPSRLAAAISGALAFLLSLFLLRNSLGDAAAANQPLATTIGGLIAAFLSAQLAAYILRLLQGRPTWPDMSAARQLALILLVSLASAALVLAIMLLVS